jgi:2-polyprenyl-3-methyl-5-hydroxy-6-metoxy-1,4-benzoquinol methylase
LKQESVEYWGIEPYSSAAKVAATKLSKVMVGTYDQNYQQLPDQYFDLVICNDVIEHMPDHDFFFTTIKQKMNESSSLVGSIPNVRYVNNLFALLVKKDWRYEECGVLDRTHLRFFTRKSLLRSITGHGFEVEQFSGINAASSKSLIPRAAKQALCLMLGADCKYQQFAFRIRPLFDKPPGDVR